ncbi:hypothetical protein ACH5RR_012607 [Cinchona calisaya]|uniref:Uncharacterized protein n=1 Tax=Cinchona calisaya TaxID=153742 RepID=A0ABD3AAM0_9GENT
MELGVDDVYREETYLVALISCWICIFALPIREIGLIRPNSFVRTNLYVVEIYSPHRFARQFGYCQDLGEHSEELPASVLERLYKLCCSCTHTGTKFKKWSKDINRVILSSVNDPTSGSVIGSKVNVEAITMDEGTSSRKRCALQEVQDETPTNGHPSGCPSQQLQLDEMSNETLLIQGSRCLKKKFASDKRSTSAGDCDSDKCWKHISSDKSPRDVANNPLGSILFITESATLDGPESDDNTILGPSQFELVVRNLGKPSDLTLFSNVKKRLLVMPTTPILAQPLMCAWTMPSIFSVTAIASE